MSELKAGVIVTPHDEGMSFDRGSDVIAVTERETEFYLKDEVDKEISKLEERIADGDNDFEIANHQNERLLKIVRHHKYKRCLAMAKWCYSMDCRMLNEASDNGTYFKESWCWKRASWYGKWKRKWLELAENFKEAK